MKANKDHDIKLLTNTALDNADANLPLHIKNSLAKARDNALTAQQYTTHVKKRWFNISSPQLAVLSICFGILFFLNQTNTNEILTIEPLPTALISTDITIDEIAIIQELEFIDWLANEQYNEHGNQHDNSDS